MKQKSDLFKLTVEIPISYLNKINDICAHRQSNRLTGRFKRDVVMDSIDVLSHCYKNEDILGGI